MEQASALDSESKRLLDVIAVSGGRVHWELACAVAGAEYKHNRSQEILRAGEFIRIHSDDMLYIDLYHDLVRETILDHIEIEQKRSIHRELLDQGERLKLLTSEELATHALLGGAEESAAVYVEQAGDDAVSQLDFERAINWYRKAIPFAQDQKSKLQSLRQRLADSLYQAGHGGDAGAIFQELASDTPVSDPEAANEHRHKAAMCYMESGHVQKGLPLLNATLERFNIRVRDNRVSTLISLLRTQLFIDWHLRFGKFKKTKWETCSSSADLLELYEAALSLACYQFLPAIEFFAQVSRLGLVLQDRRIATLALDQLSTVSAFDNTPANRKKAMRYLSAARKIAYGRGDVKTAISSSVIHCEQHFLAGRWRASLRTFNRFENYKDYPGFVLQYLIVLRRTQFVTLFYLGELHTLRELAPACLADAKRRNNVFGLTLAATTGIFARLAADEVEGAKKQVELAKQTWYVEGIHLQHWFEYQAELHIALYEADWVQSEGLLRKFHKRLSRSVLKRIQYMRIKLNYLKACCLMQRCIQSHDRAPVKEIRKCGKLISQETALWCAPFGIVLEAGCARLEGNTEHAIQQLELASRKFLARDMPLYALASDFAAARILGDDETANQKLEILSSHGAQNAERFAYMLVPIR